MWCDRYTNPGRNICFFYLSLSHDNLANYYQLNFNLMQHHKYSLTELDNMIPFEREIYINMLMEWIEKENERIQREQK
jgi:hypothetical protein